MINLFERAIASIAPGAAVRRAASRHALEIMASGYEGAKISRFRSNQAGYHSMAIDEDRHVGAIDRNNLRLESRDLRRNNGPVFGILNRFANFVVGSGITPQAKTKNEDWNKEAEAYWREWEKIADFRGMSTLAEIQRLIVKARLCDGEAGFVLTNTGQLQPIESERIQTPKNKKESENLTIFQGIELSDFGRPLAFYVCHRNSRGMLDGLKYDRIAERDFVHVSNAERFDQVHGISELASVINNLRDKGEFSDATLFKAKLDAWKAWAIFTDAPIGPATLGPRVGTSSNASGTMVKYEKNEQGEYFYLPQGSKMESMQSKTPNAEYVGFTRNIWMEIGAALSCPYQILMLDLADLNFSASRAALLIAYNTFAIWQEWLISRFLQRTWNWRIAKAIKAGELAPAPLNARGVSDWYNVEWIPPSWEWVDPRSEAAANQSEYNMGVKTLTMIARQKGRDAEDLLAEKGRDIKAAQRIAAELGIDWHDLIMSTQPGQTSPAQTSPAQTSPAQNSKNEPA